MVWRGIHFIDCIYFEYIFSQLDLGLSFRDGGKSDVLLYLGRGNTMHKC